MSNLMSPVTQNERLRHIAYKWGWLRLAHDFVESLETLARDGIVGSPSLNVTGDPSALFLIRIKNESNGITTSARWENNGLKVSRPNHSNQFYDTQFDGKNLEFKDATPKEIALAVLGLAREAPIAGESSH